MRLQPFRVFINSDYPFHMLVTERIKKLSKNLPEEENVKRFYKNFTERHPKEVKGLLEEEGLLSDVLTLVAFSPFLAATILQNPKYISWLKHERKSSAMREKEELLESLARFAFTNSFLETNALLASFRRRELLRIYLKDIRRLGTIAEITEELSNLADSILEYALQLATQKLDNLYGMPLEIDKMGRLRRAKFCVVALGKLGSKELNYSSDIDLLFLYSSDGYTSGKGSREKTSNRQYFIKLAQTISKLIGEKTGGGAAYRVDLRLRPNGRAGALTLPLKEIVKYYKKSSQMWERQVLIRSRLSAGDVKTSLEFFSQLNSCIFSTNETVENALSNVLKSKQKIDFEKLSKKGFDVKLGKGGIREIEFIAQALQLSFAGIDPWLRSSHTLISLSRLADRELIKDNEFAELSEAYSFLRRLEHRLQMEHGVQTHLVPEEPKKSLLISKRMGMESLDEFNIELRKHTEKVSGVFKRIFGYDYSIQNSLVPEKSLSEVEENRSTTENLESILFSLKKSDNANELNHKTLETLKTLAEISPPFSAMVAANPSLIRNLTTPESSFTKKDYEGELLAAIQGFSDFAKQLAILRKFWSQFILEIVITDIFQKEKLQVIKKLQTDLAEASVKTALFITKTKLENDYKFELLKFPLAVLGLGKLGSGGMDYGSDIDLILVYDDEKPCPIKTLTKGEFYSKAVEIFVTTLSSLTREGSLYRVDLRLRPDGKNGVAAVGKLALLNYLKNRADIWEWLAYVKLRAIAGDKPLAKSTEKKARNLIHLNASQSDPKKIKDEAYKIRKRLEVSKVKKKKEVDIKFGEGGLQDVYFTIRYLQLRNNLPDTSNDRSTLSSLKRLREKDFLSQSHFENLSKGYGFLSELDHNLRLTVGRSTCLPVANSSAFKTITKRMRFNSIDEALETISYHRLNINSSFEDILGNHTRH